MRGPLGRSDEVVRREASDWLVLVHDPEAEVDRAAFERWRAADPRHGEAYARAERAWDRAALLSETRFARDRHRPGRRDRSVRPGFRYAAAVAVVVVVTILGLSFTRLWPFASSDHQQIEVLASRFGQIDRIALADGSTVTLDSDSAVRVAITERGRRLQLVRGRARFDVAHDAARPFVVSAGSGSVTARGTIFDVSLFDGRINVALLKGAVDIRNGPFGRDGKPAATRVRLVPGQQLSFVGSTALPPPQPFDRQETEWPTGMLAFDGTPLGKAIADMNRYSALQIRVDDPSLEVRPITGAYRVGDAMGFAAGVAASLGLKVSRPASGGVVLSESGDGSAIK